MIRDLFMIAATITTAIIFVPIIFGVIVIAAAVVAP